MSLLLLLKPKEAGAPAPAPAPVLVFPGRPIPILEIAYESPGSAPNWIDESAYLLNFTLDRGRSTELDRQEAGTATLVLSNRDGRFDPVNVLGPYYPNVLPMRRIRLRCTIPSQTPTFVMRSSHNRDSGGDTQRAGDTEIALYSGFVESWSQTWQLANGDAAVTVRCVDAFKIFNLAEFIWAKYYDIGGNFLCGVPQVGNITPATGTPHPPDDLTGTRIGRVLDCIGWPAEDRLIDPGTVTLWGSDGTSNITVTSNSLAHLNDVAMTEGGFLFMNAIGQVRFIDAVHVPIRDTSEVYGGASGEIHFRDIAAPFDDARLWNDITVSSTRPDLIADTLIEDAASIAKYYRREFTITLLPTNLSTLQARASTLLVRYREPQLRIEQLTLAPTTAAEWQQILKHELADKVLVRKRPAVAPLIERELRIEGIRIDAPGGVPWIVTWTLSGF